jgi:hypothetical protein
MDAGGGWADDIVVDETIEVGREAREAVAAYSGGEAPDRGGDACGGSVDSARGA